MTDRIETALREYAENNATPNEDSLYNVWDKVDVDHLAAHLKAAGLVSVETLRERMQEAKKEASRGEFPGDYLMGINVGFAAVNRALTTPSDGGGG